MFLYLRYEGLYLQPESPIPWTNGRRFTRLRRADKPCPGEFGADSPSNDMAGRIEQAKGRASGQVNRQSVDGDWFVSCHACDVSLLYIYCNA
jgi:hypothetical protein